MTLTFKRIVIAICVIGAIAISPFQLGADEPTSTATGLLEGWEKTVVIPEIKGGRLALQQASQLKLWVQQGWLIASYETPDRGPEWEIVLAQSRHAEEPQVRLERPRGFEIEYGRYFIRENTGHLRVMRERKTNDSPPWPAVSINEDAKPESFMSSGNGSIHIIWTMGNWRWLSCGIMDNVRGLNLENTPRRNDIWMRVRHAHELPSLQVRAEGSVGIPAEHNLTKLYDGGYITHDEGDLLIAERSVQTEERIRNALSKVLQGKEAPELVCQRCYNTDTIPSLKQLQGKVVMLYFWDEQNYQPFAAILQRQFKDRGLEVIAVHPLLGAEALTTTIKEKNIDLPIIVDNRSSETQRKYSVKVLPTYVVIDRAGKVQHSYLENPPIKEIEELLKDTK